MSYLQKLEARNAQQSSIYSVPLPEIDLSSVYAFVNLTTDALIDAINSAERGSVARRLMVNELKQREQSH